MAPSIGIEKDPIPPDTFARRLKMARKLRGWSQQQLADASGCTKAIVSSCELGNTLEVKMNLIYRMADALGTNPRWLIQGRGNRVGIGPISDVERDVIVALRHIKDPAQGQMIAAIHALAAASTITASHVQPFPFSIPQPPQPNSGTAKAGKK